MCTLKTISPSLYYVGVNDRTKHRFEGLWPLPYGVSYNSYLIVSDRVALIDTVDAPFSRQLIKQIEQAIGDRAVDYLVINHMEPDHSSSIAAVKMRWPNVRIVGNAKTLTMLSGFYGLCEGCQEIKEGETLSLGGRTLRFSMIPMVHWPETMVTYCIEDKILFTGDAFGCFGALNGAVTDDAMNVERYWDEMIRYYSNIVGKYGVPVQNALRKLSSLELQALCPTHGPVWREHIQEVVSMYDRMSRYEVSRGAVIAYGSMYGNTERMAEQIASALSERGVRDICMHNLSSSDVSFVLRDIFKYDTLVIGSPTYNGELFPPVASLLEQIAGRAVPARNFGYFGSYSWAGTAVKKLAAFGEKMGWPSAGPIELKHGYSRDKLSGIADMADLLVERMGM